MGLSREMRQALLDRAAGLRAEVQSAQSARTDAEAKASQDRRDLKLIAEVERLEREKAAAEAGRDQAIGTVEAAVALMEAAASGVVLPESEQDNVINDPSLVGESAVTDNKSVAASASTTSTGKGASKSARSTPAEGTEVN